MSNDFPHLDTQVLNDLREIMEGEFSNLLRTFIADSRLRLSEIDIRYSAGDPQALRRAAHSYKGSSANIGAPQLAELCRQLEAEANAGNLAPAAELIRQIKAESDVVLAELQAWL